MKFSEAETRYHILKRRLKSGEINNAFFTDEINKLRLKDQKGNWWQINQEDGNWLKWDGEKWTKSKIPETEKSSSSQKAAEAPETLFQLLVMMIKGIIKGIVKKSAIFMTIFFLAWMAHTYLLAGPNNGYWKVSNQFLGMILALKGRVLGGTLFWILSFGIVRSLIRRTRETGLGDLLKKISHTPKQISQAYQGSGSKAVSIILIACALAVFVALRLNNRIVSLLISLGVFLSLSMGFAGFLFLVTRLTWSDLYRILKIKRLKKFQSYQAYLILFGICLGFLISAGLPFLPFSGYLLIVVMVAYSFIKNKSAAANCMITILIFGIILYTKKALGHDGGAYEAGGWENWLTSQGALTAVLYGIPPAFGAALGTVLGGGALSGVTSGGGTRILSGQEAIDWLEQQGLYEDGVLTDLFWNGWDSRLPDGEHPYGLGAIAGEWDRDHRKDPIGEVTIVVTDDNIDLDDTDDTDQQDTAETDKGNDQGDSSTESDQSSDQTSDTGQNDSNQTGPRSGNNGNPVKEPDKVPADEPEKIPEKEPTKEPPKEPEKTPEKGPEKDAEGMPVGVDPIQFLKDKMNQIIKDKGDKYWVKNPDLSDSWLQYIPFIGRNNPAPGIIVKLLNNFLIDPVVSRLSSWEGGQCGEFSEWGVKWSGGEIEKMFGKGAFVDQIVLERNSAINHAATKVILPNGERYVMDFWEGMQEGEARVYTEQEWLSKWKDKLGGSPEVRYRGYLETQLKNLVSILGNEEEAIEMFIESNKKGEVIDTIVKSYRRDPW